jgi:hypothetical protein
VDQYREGAAIESLVLAYAAKVDGNPSGSNDGEFIHAASLEDVECK